MIAWQAPSAHVTHHAHALCQACKRIPKGKVTTYGTLAKVLSSSARAVGQVSEAGWRTSPRTILHAWHSTQAATLLLLECRACDGTHSHPSSHATASLLPTCGSAASQAPGCASACRFRSNSGNTSAVLQPADCQLL